MNKNFRELVEEFPRDFRYYKTRNDDDIIKALCGIDLPNGDFYLHKDLLNHLHQGETAYVKGYLIIELGSRHTPIVLWATVRLDNFDEEEGTFEYEYGWEYHGWDYYFDIKDELGDYLYPRADYLEFMK